MQIMLATRRSSFQPGFSLVELMIVLLLVGAIVAIGAPSFGDFARNNRLTAAANDFLAVVQAARTEAAKRQSTVSVCGTSAPNSASAVCNAGDFTGWIAFDDRNSNCTRDAGEPILRTGGPLDQSLGNSADGACISYQTNGFVTARAGVPPLTRLIFCDSRGLALQAGTNQSAARGIQIQPGGRAQVLRDADRLGSWEIACNVH